MPAYQNQTAGTISYNGTAWGPGETHAVTFFVPGEIGLTQTAEAPRVESPTLASGVITFADENDPPHSLYVPDCNAFKASFVVSSGRVTLQENYADNPVEVSMSAANGFNAVSRRIDVERYFITPLAAATVTYNISRVI